MKVDKKLEMFRDIIMKGVEAKSRQGNLDMGETFRSAVDEEVRAAEKQAQERIRAERYNVDKVNNKEIVSASAKAKRMVIELREQLTDSLFTDVTADVADFAGSPEYGEYLVNAAARARQGSSRYAFVQLLAKDMRFAGAIEAATGLKAEAVDAGWLGGFRLLTEDRRALSDHTLDNALAEVRKGFTIPTNNGAV